MSRSVRRIAATFSVVLFTAAVTLAPASRAELRAQTTRNPDPRYWKLTGNSGTDPATNFLGTTDNQPLIVRVNGTRVFRLEPTSGTPNIIGGFSGNTAAGGYEGATIGGGGQSEWPNSVVGSFGTVSGGYGNKASEVGFGIATVGGGFRNTAGGAATVGGGVLNTAGFSATVAGGYLNTANGESAAIGGGEGNRASGNWATVSGGRDNSADDFATVGGGADNNASGNAAIVGGGILNIASRDEAAIGGGLKNAASAPLATVGGGQENVASGLAATVPGGRFNTAGTDAFAAGRRAKATHTGSFVWGDSTDADVNSTGANQFIARASGGVTFYSNSSSTAGVTLPPGGGSWSSASDAAVKDNVTRIDPREILEGVASLSLSTWNYESQASSIRHIGPMAQDFKEAFGVGEDERYITTVDANGVALAAIQGLNQKIEALEERLARNRGTQTAPANAGVWQAAALLVLALGIGLAGLRVREPVGGWWPSN